MTKAERRAAATVALEALRVVIDDRWIELVALEKARDEIEANPTACDADPTGKSCSGPRGIKWCSRCGVLARRCEVHGGARRAAFEMDAHEAEHEHAAIAPPSTTTRTRRSV